MATLIRVPYTAALVYTSIQEVIVREYNAIEQARKR